MGKFWNEFKRQGNGFGKELKRQGNIALFGKSYDKKNTGGKHHPKCSSTHRRYCGGKK